jgi:hypothetical protein
VDGASDEMEHGERVARSGRPNKYGHQDACTRENTRVFASAIMDPDDVENNGLGDIAVRNVD